MPAQHPREIGFGHVIERYVTPKDTGRARYFDLNSGRILRPGWPHAEVFARRMAEDAAVVTDAELSALLGYEWRSRVTGANLIGVGRRTSFREQLRELLLASDFCFAGSAYCFALARFGTAADAEILTAYLDRYLPRTDLRYDQPAALGALVHLDTLLGTDHATRFTEPDGGLWKQWVDALVHLRDHPAYTPEEQGRYMGLRCAFYDGATAP
ncbi:DUF6000 family protein [Streptomyces xanthii]|uniref:Uncharacterized protein n=1 Tax=Streptomyces xanthii TaxID=2768069 RepID=A0A7H1B6I8_9ACTN|nr:DUF6000 family protein [Streptomyces xanthii]QNS04343.1 hypothetical protein IAG42_12380 [Streptomyces xanthii]